MPVDLSVLPTDSLYKFLAISGVLITLTTIFFFGLFVYRTHMKVIAAKTDLEVLRVQLDDVALRLERAKGSGQSDDTARAEYLQNKMDSARLRGKGNEIAFLESRISLIARLTALGLGIGMTSAALGFFLWYSRIQVFQDALIRVQARAILPADLGEPCKTSDPQSP